MEKQLISVGYGKQSFSGSNASFSAFVVTPQFERNLPSKVFGRQGSCQRFPASEHPDINGHMFTDSIPNVPDGTIIALQASHRQKATPVRDGAVFLCTRATGPMLTVSAMMVPARESKLQRHFLVFQGRADILDPDDLEAYGIRPNKNYLRNFTDEEEVAECYIIQEIGAQIAAKPVVEIAEDRDGNKVTLQRRPGRKRTLRRGV